MSFENNRINLTLPNNLMNSEISENKSTLSEADAISIIANVDNDFSSVSILIAATNTTYNTTFSKNSTIVPVNVFESQLIIPLYVIIFVLAVVGNSLVLVTLIRNKRMRTVTNVYLLNLAISDLLLGVFCMPFTLVGQVLRNFIFGLTMCKLIPYFQAVSVSVGVWTLVAISLERYFAICRPLKSRRWQTQFHAYKMIAVVWLASLFWSGPVLVVSSLRAMKRGYKCREDWPSRESERIFNLFLDVMLLLVPMIIMSLAYSLIMSKLWKGLQREIEHNTSCQQQKSHTPALQRSTSSPTINEPYGKNNNSSRQSDKDSSSFQRHRLAPPCNARIITTFSAKDTRKKNSDKTETVKMWILKGFEQVRLPSGNRGFREYNKPRSTLVPSSKVSSPTTPEQFSSNGHYTDFKNKPPKNEETTTYTFSRHAIRSNYMDKSIEAKKKVIRMLFVIVAEFFICWAPLHILNTWYLFYPQDVYKYVGSTGIALVQLLAYFSSCCNPITYCFMNRKFRQAFLTVFNCYSCCICITEESSIGAARCPHNGILKVTQNHSDASCNDSTVYVGRASTIGRSEVLVLEAEDRV